MYILFLLINLRKNPKNLEEASDFLEFAALSGYKEAYVELAWLYEGYRKKNYNKEIFKWYYLCSFFEKDEQTNNDCKKDLEKVKKRLSFYELNEIKVDASDWISNQTERLSKLNNILKPNKKDRYDFGNYYALLIGAQDYQNYDNLKTPIRDIMRISNILSERYNFKTELLKNPNRVKILKTLNKYTKILKENDNFIIYFAGHGMQRSDEGFWIPVDAEKDDDVNWISNNNIVRKIREMQAKNILVLADACFSGLITRGLSNKDIKTEKTAIDILNETKTRIAITSGNNEPVLDGGGGENSIFASALSSELTAFNEPFTASSLFLKLQKRVIKESMAYGNQQNPVIMDIPKSGHENFDFVFNPQ
ncbi:caspase family protein [Alphaproteobacteria bacterium]|nr:caspase family protein [Alphaproteobacteria bacterium]